MDLGFSGQIVEWRGPAPFYFVALPPDEGVALGDEVHERLAVGR